MIKDVIEGLDQNRQLNAMVVDGENYRRTNYSSVRHLDAEISAIIRFQSGLSIEETFKVL
jgi:hypothetical protein